MKLNFFLNSAPAVVQQAIINYVFGRKTEMEACEIIKLYSPNHLFLSMRFFGIVKTTDKNKRFRLNAEYKDGLQTISDNFFPKVSLVKKLLNYKQYSKLSKAGSYAIMVLEKKLIVKHLDCKL